MIAARENEEELLDTILPFIWDSGVKSYIEPIIHSGRNFDVHEHDPLPDLYARIQPYMVRQNCTRVAYLFAVHNNGYAAPCISILPEFLEMVPGYEDLNIRNPDGSIKDLCTLRHTHPLLVMARSQTQGCLCERFNLQVAELIRQGKAELGKKESLRYEGLFCETRPNPLGA